MIDHHEDAKNVEGNNLARGGIMFEALASVSKLFHQPNSRDQRNILDGRRALGSRQVAGVPYNGGLFKVHQAPISQ